MELSSFETSAFSRRQVERFETKDKAWLRRIRSAGAPIVGFGIVVSLGYITVSSVFSISHLGNILTPDRFLVLIVVFLIGVTPFVKQKRKRAEIPPPPPPMVPVASAQSVSPSREHNLPPQQPMFSNERMLAQYSAPVPSRFDQPMHLGISSMSKPMTRYAPAPFIDDVHSSPKHEFLELLPGWARLFEERILMPMIIRPFIQALDESDTQLTFLLSQVGYKLSTKRTTKNPLAQSDSVLTLSDRFLPTILDNRDDIKPIWHRRLLLESLVTVPEFHQEFMFRDYIVGRVREWAERGVRFNYRPDYHPDSNLADGPTDSHILSHLLFSSFDAQMGITGGEFQAEKTFKAKYVSEKSRDSSSMLGGRMRDLEFNSLFGDAGMKSAHHNKMVWLEQIQANGKTGPIHFNVATHQKSFGVTPGAGNILEALCLFFHLLKKMSPSAVWHTFPHEMRIALDSILVASSGDSLTGGLLSSGLMGSAQPSMPALGGFY